MLAMWEDTEKEDATHRMYVRLYHSVLERTGR